MDCRNHPNDQRLFDCYVASRMGEPADPRAAEHLAECGECAARYRSLATFMNDVRAEADAESDELFSASMMQRQREQILERLSHVHRTARVIAFPAAQAAGSGQTPVRIPSRWLAAAAAAGLFIGVALGGFFGTGTLRGGAAPGQQVLSAPPAAQTPSLNAAAELPDDDAFLMELETALTSPQLSELQPFDALTPHVREIAVRVR